MKQVTNGFKLLVPVPGKEDKKQVTVLSSSIEINVESMNPVWDGELFKSMMRTCSIDSSDSGLITEEEVNVRWGLKVNGAFEMIDYGNFIVKESKDDRKMNLYQLRCCDYMIKFMVDYRGAWVDYPCTMMDYLQAICTYIDVELYNTEFFNDDLMIPHDYFDGMEITYRDVLDQIAEATCSTIFIKDNKLFLSGLNDTGEILNPVMLNSVIIGERFKPLNSFVLARSPQIGDDVYRPVEEPEDVSELSFVNNQFLDKRRDEVIDAMFAYLEGITFWSFECEELGAGYFEPCDLVTAQDREGNTFDRCLIVNADIKMNSGSGEHLSSKIPVQSTTRYKYATTIQKAQKRTEIIVDKLENTIFAIAQEQDAQGMRLAQLLLQVDGIGLDVRARSGVNLLRNSVGHNDVEHWEVTGDASGIQDSYINNNTVSKSAIRVINGQLNQIISTVIGHAYAITFKYRKSIARGYVTWTDGENVTTIIDNITLCNSYSEISTVYTAQSNQCDFSFGSDGDYFEITDLVIIDMEIRPGETVDSVAVPWSPNPNEVYGTNIFIDAINGMTIFDFQRTLKNVLNSEGMAIVNTLNGNVLLQVTSTQTYIQYLQTEKTRVGNSVHETSDGWYVSSIIGGN